MSCILFCFLTAGLLFPFFGIVASKRSAFTVYKLDFGIFFHFVVPSPKLYRLCLAIVCTSLVCVCEGVGKREGAGRII